MVYSKLSTWFSRLRLNCWRQCMRKETKWSTIALASERIAEVYKHDIINNVWKERQMFSKTLAWEAFRNIRRLFGLEWRQKWSSIYKRCTWKACQTVIRLNKGGASWWHWNVWLVWWMLFVGSVMVKASWKMKKQNQKEEIKMICCILSKSLKYSAKLMNINVFSRSKHNRSMWIDYSGW